jgi:methenyltetrahydrofolate cyclohydrolase
MNGPPGGPTQPGSSRPGGADASAPPAYLDMAVGRFLDALSATTPDPGGGAVAALAVTLAAGLCAMTAGLSRRHLAAAERLAEQARLLRDRAAPLAQADAEAYRAVLAAMRTRDGLADALSRACAVPMQVAEVGAEVAAVAAAVAAEGNPAVRGDAITAALLAAAGARAAATLVRINLAGADGDGRPARAERLAAEAARRAAATEQTAR